jgi:ketosteroid isomerase-like protein
MTNHLSRRRLLGTAAAAATTAAVGTAGVYAASPASAANGNDERNVASRTREWVFGWDRAEEDGEFVFRDTFGHLYDWHGTDNLYYDNFDPEHRIARSVAEYESIWEPIFNQLRTAEHWIAREPDVTRSGDFASAYVVFIARLTTADGTVIGNRATSALVWRRTRGGWRIMRDHTSSVLLTPEELAEAIAKAEA